MSPPPDALAFDPLLLLGVAVAATPVALRLARADPRASRWRWVSLGTAVLLLAAVLFSPIQTLAEHYLLTAHLAQVLVLMGGAPPLLLLALPRTPPLWPTPRVLRRLGRFAVHPVVALITVNAVFFVTHWTTAFDDEVAHGWLFDLSLLALLAASVAFWWPIVSPTGRTVLLSPLGKLGYILLATIPQTFAGLLLALAPKLVYSVYVTAPIRVLDISARTDQQLAGACLAILSKIALFAAFSVIFVRVMNPGSDGDDGGGGGGGGPQHEPVPPPPGEPAWYRAMERGRVRPEPVPERPPLVAPREPAGSSGSR